MLILAALFAQAAALGPVAVTNPPEPMAAGQGAWIEGAHSYNCGLPATICAKRAFDLGKPAEAVHHLQAAARKGDSWAMRAIGLILLRGEGAERDPEQGVSWLYEASLRGDREAMGALGAAFREGLGVKADPKLAAYWTARARR